nr:tetraprenyl-beta-curcumene synthase family protein [Virgibacillus halotolerans]
MSIVYRKIFPEVNNELTYWKSRAEEIPNKELRGQALASIETKRFHCQGGGVYALLAGKRWKEAVRFIVAYQTISDYLDNLCDRSTSMDPADFSLLHQAMNDALTPDSKLQNYYLLREDQEDGNYLADLVQTCQATLGELDEYGTFQNDLLQLEGMYKDLQVHKHVKVAERVPRLTNWFNDHKQVVPTLSWYEFSAAAGSTLGIFCLVCYALGGRIMDGLTEKVYQSYFPYVQGLHILLDYYIDQQEDMLEADLNFCSYYPTQQKMQERLLFFIEKANKQVQKLPDSGFHEMVIKGLVGLYLGDAKVNHIEGSHEMKKEMLKISGYKARFFHWNTKFYYKIKPG